MQYIKLFALWSLASTTWGIIGTTFGPGIVMLIIALTVGTVGYLLTTFLAFFDYRVYWLYTGMIVSALSLIFSMYLIRRLSGFDMLILVPYICLFGFGLSFFATKLFIRIKD